jgi:hypothetical protein
MPAIIIITAEGQGNRGDDYNEHLTVWTTIPESVRGALTMTDNDPGEPDGAETGETSITKWWGEITTEQWAELRRDWCIEPDDCDDTLGMILGPPYGHLPALAFNAVGTDWNVGGVYGVDWVSVYFLTDDPDFDMMADDYVRGT